MTANLFWLGGDPPASTDRAPTLRHQVHAETLRSRPGRWALLADIEPNAASSIARGLLVPYRPGGSFEAVIRRGRVYARFVGEEAHE